MINLVGISGGINSSFGPRKKPTAGATSNHKGIDITLKSDNIPSVMGGTVIGNYWNKYTGNSIVIKNDDGVTAKYFHMANKSPLAIGTRVTEGQTIGIQGSTGASTGKHLHFQVEKNGTPFNPVDYLSGGVTDFVTSGGQVSSDYQVNQLGFKETALGIVGNIIQVIAVILIVIFAVYLFMKAFDIKIRR